MERITVSMAPDLADAYPARRPARVTVSLKDGRVLELFQATRKGDAAALLRQLWTGSALPGFIPLRGA